MAFGTHVCPHKRKKWFSGSYLNDEFFVAVLTLQGPDTPIGHDQRFITLATYCKVKIYRIRYIFSAMPFRGSWTSRCQNCHQNFTIEIKAGERLADFARRYMCPNCHRSPEDVLRRKDGWHEIIDFHANIKSLIFRLVGRHFDN